MRRCSSAEEFFLVAVRLLLAVLFSCTLKRPPPLGPHGLGGERDTKEEELVARSVSYEDLRSRGAFRATEGEGVAPELAVRWLSVSVQTRAVDGTWWALPAGGSLRSGEVMAVEVELLRPAHIYVIGVDGAGQAVLLFPDAKYERDAMLGVGTHRLPPETSVRPNIKLDSNTGKEQLFIVAASVHVSSVDSELGKLIQKMEEGKDVRLHQEDRKKARRDERQRKKPRSRSRRRRFSLEARARNSTEQSLWDANEGAVPPLNSRGSFRSRAGGAAIDAVEGDDGVVVVPFQYEHI